MDRNGTPSTGKGSSKCFQWSLANRLNMTDVADKLFVKRENWLPTEVCVFRAERQQRAQCEMKTECVEFLEDKQRIGPVLVSSTS